jgi:hypothetical protein
MSRRRRMLLKSLGLACAPLPQVAAAAVLESRPGSGVIADTVRVLLDTLIPADETPAASGLGLDRELLAAARRRPEYWRLIEQATAWLDAAARRLGATSFAAAGENVCLRVVRQAEQEPAGSLPREMFDRVREDALTLYYTHPATWLALGYSGPPQPVGFPDFERPPPTRK